MVIRPLEAVSSLLLTAGLLVFPACSEPGKQPEQPQRQNMDRPSAGPVTTPSAGHDEQTGATTTLPRILSNTFLPATPKKGDELAIKAIAAEHPAGQVELVYRWAVNDAVVAGAYGPTLKMSLVKGDRVSVTIIPEVAGMQGQPLVRTAVINNAPPLVQNNFVDVQISKNHFSARIKAEDPDGDSLSYTLLKGPKGLTVNHETGELAWDFGPSDAGTQELSISVKDNDNAEVVLKIPLRLESGKRTD